MAKETIISTLTFSDYCPLWKLPDQLLVEIFIRVPIADWGHLSCVSKYWANLFREEYLWNAALIRYFPLATQGKSWPGPIPRGMSKRRFAALYLSNCIFTLENDELSEIIGHTYLFLKEQLEVLAMPYPSGILHGTIIVIENLKDNHQTFSLLQRLAFEEDVFLPYPYSRSYKVHWKTYERLFTDFRDCMNQTDYYDLLVCAKQKFQHIPATWLGF